MSGAAELLAELVAIDSVSARPNRPMVERLARQLEVLGFSLRLHAYADEHGVEKHNLVAWRGPSLGDAIGSGGLALVGHTDTVPYDPAWTEALRLTERDGRLYGRGSCDTKGFIAAALAAIDAVDLERLVRPLVCVFTADEEVGCVGVQRLLADVELRPAHAIVGEPTSLVPVRAHKGYWLAEVEVEGREGHSSAPSAGRSAIFDAAHLLRRIEGIAERLREEPDPAFDPDHTTINVGRIQGGRAPNVIPGRCAFSLEWRPLPGQRGEHVEELLAAEVEALRREDPGFSARFTTTWREPAADTAPDAPIVRFLEEASGARARTVSFGTELPYLNAIGAPGCVFGPGDILTAHRTGEFVPADELDRASAILRAAIERFCIG